MEKQTVSGDLLEVDRYYAARDGRRIPRNKNIGESSQYQNDLNNRNAQRKIVQLINTNFSRKQGDVFVTLTYKEPPEDEATAKREFGKFTRKTRAYRRENELLELRYINITENQGQWHHHIIMNGLPLDVITKLWGRGRVTVSILDNTYTFVDLAKYLIKPEKKAKKKPDKENGQEDDNAKEPRRKFARRWSCSKNLKKPEVTKKIIKRVTKSEPKAPKGYRLLPDWIIGSDCQGNLFQYFKCVKLDVSDVKAIRKPNAKRRK